MLQLTITAMAGSSFFRNWKGPVLRALRWDERESQNLGKSGRMLDKEKELEILKAFKEEAKPIDVYSSKGLGILKGYILQEA